MTRVLSLLSACFNPEETIVRACLSVDTQKLPRDPFIEHLILDGNWSDGTWNAWRPTNCAGEAEVWVQLWKEGSSLS